MHKSNSAVFLVLLFAAFSFGFTQTGPPKGKLFIIGGGDRTDELMQRLVKESGIDQGGYGVVLPMSSEEPDTAFYYVNTDFVALGCKNVRKLFCTKEQAFDAAKADSIRHAKLIYISGGDQSRFMDVVEGSPVMKAIQEAYQNGSTIAGTSAGAAVMSKIMITGNTLKGKDYTATFNTIEADNIEIRAGLGLITNAIIDQHFVKRSRHNRLITAMIEYPEMKGIGIDESTAILVKGNDVEVVGESQVLVYTNPKKSRNINMKSQKLGAHGLTLDVYLPGEHFPLK